MPTIAQIDLSSIMTIIADLAIIEKAGSRKDRSNRSFVFSHDLFLVALRS